MAGESSKQKMVSKTSWDDPISTKRLSAAKVEKLLVIDNASDDDDEDDDMVNLRAYEIDTLTPLLEEMRKLRVVPRKKLLVLCMNGLLAHTIHRSDKAKFAMTRRPDGNFGQKLVFRRPFCDEFLKFCFDKYEVGIWSTARKYNVDPAINIIMGDLRSKLLFTWNQSECTAPPGYMSMEKSHKPLFFKELKKLWDNESGYLPWEKGRFSSSNTLMIDDSPYKAFKNPPNTAIFPYPYSADHIHDNSIGQNGDLRVYLERLAVVYSIPAYVKAHPFGQSPITTSHPDWNFYSKFSRD